MQVNIIVNEAELELLEMDTDDIVEMFRVLSRASYETRQGGLLFLDLEEYEINVEVV